MTDVKESSQSTEIPLVFRRTPRTLVSMAALELALLCWQHEISNLYPDEMDYSWQLYFTTTHKFISEFFHVPNRIAEIIDCHIEQFETVFENFINCLPPRMQYFSDSKTEVISKVLKNIVFEPCGTIIDIKTVRKLVTGDLFEPLDRFELACFYSLEADIERLWPLVSDDTNFNPFDEGKLYYWRCRMRNELNKIPRDEQDSPEFNFITSYDYGFYYWTDVEFLWHKLKHREQTYVLINSDPFNQRVTHYLLSKLNHTQLKEVLTRIPCLIMKNLSEYDYTFEYALETWNFMKNFITGEQFFNVLHILWEKAYCWPRNGRVDVLLHKIWLEAPSNLKNYVLVNHVEDFFNNYISSMGDYGCDLRFLRCLLSNTSFEKRNELWVKNWHKFLLLAIPDDFDKFMRLCFENEIDIAKFKDNVLSDFKQMPDYVNELIRGGFSRELIAYLRFFSSDENLIEEIKVLIIKLVLDKEVLYYDSRAINNFAISFIDSIRFGVDLLPEFFSLQASEEFFSFNPKSPLISFAEYFKECFIRCNLNAFFRMIDVHQNELNRVKDFIDDVLSSNDKCLVEVKRSFYEHCRSRLCSGDLKIYRMRDWDEFSKWCAPSQQEFRRSLPVDHIFEILLTEVIRGIRGSNSVPNDEYELSYSSLASQIRHKYQSMINFLLWYFEDDAAKMNKLRKIYGYCDVGVISYMLRENDESMISDVLNCFFDDDIEKIENFNSRVIDK